MKQTDELKDLIAAGILFLGFIMIGIIIVMIMVSTGGV